MAEFYEKQVKSFAALRAEFARLDSDSGVRLAGEYGGSPCFAFVTRFQESYTVMIYERRRNKIPDGGRLLLAKDFTSLPRLEELLRRIAGGRVDAHVY